VFNVLKVKDRKGLCVVLGLFVFLIFLQNALCSDEAALKYKNLTAANLSRIEQTNGLRARFSFIAMGDTKRGTQVLERLVDKINSEKDISFVLYVGDMVEYSTPEFYNKFCSIMSKLKFPYITMAGNHEYYGDGIQMYKDIFGPTNYSFIYRRVGFVGVDTRYGKEINWDWFINALSDMRKHRNLTHLIVFMHIPPFDPRPGGGHCLSSETAQLFAKLMDDFQVDLVICGHIHIYWYGDWKGTKYLITGGAGAELAASPEDGGVYHYAIVSIKGEEIEVTPVVPLEIQPMGR